MVENVSTLRRKRTLKVNLIKNKFKEFLEKENQNEEQVSALLSAIEKSFEIIETIGMQIAAEINEEEEEIEVASSFDIVCECQEIILKVKKVIKVLTDKEKLELIGKNECASGGTMKLPALKLPTFNGNILEYTTFRERFSAVDTRQDLNETEKLSYLMGLMSGPALELLNGLSICQKNYKPALEILHKEFGDVGKVRIAHVNNLLKIRKPEATPTGMRDFALEIMKTIRQLQAVDFECNTKEVECILTQIILGKIPDKLKPKTNMYVHPERSNLQVATLIDILKRISEEMTDEITEFDVQDPTNHVDNSYHTAAVVTQSSKVCPLCSNSHDFWKCYQFQSDVDRKMRAQSLNLCQKCFKKGHLTEQCNKIVCGHCKIPGHQADKCYKLSKNHETDREVSLIQVVKTKNNKIALPTAKIKVGHDANAVANVVFDMGSQKTFVTKDIAKRCKFKILGKTEMIIDGFDSVGSRQSYDIVSIPIYADGHMICVEAAVTNRLPRVTSDGLAKQLKRMDNLGYVVANKDGTDNYDIDILIGCDYYFSFIEGKVIEGVNVIESVFGLMVAGPISSNHAIENVAKIARRYMQAPHANTSVLA